MSSPPLRALEREFRRQLLPGVGGLTTYADRYDAQLQRLREATPVQAKAEFARLGGVVKSWRQYLKQGITLAVLGSIRPGREHVRKWQLDRFGQSQTSAHLRQFADEARAGGGRVIAVATGPYPIATLQAHRPDYLFGDLTVTDAVLRALFDDQQV